MLQMYRQAIGNIATAEALFYPVFYSCLVIAIGERGKEITFKLIEGDKERTCWKYHC